MGTYLLTWNPQKSAEPKFLKSLDDSVSPAHPLRSRWSCGNNKSILVGDRVFLLRQGKDKPGIVAAGWVTKPSYYDTHWSPEKQSEGRKALYIMADFEDVRPPEQALSKTDLLNDVLPEALLNVACSGPMLSDTIAESLERRWSQHLGVSPRISSLTIGTLTALEGQPVEHRGYRHYRDQGLRRAALDKAGGVCAVCEVDFSKILGGLGIRALQVHHRRQLALEETPKINTVDDLAVVCANCHSLLHLDSCKALEVAELKKLLRPK